jgi:RimJ/RimL family protein N-acetyltransferase
VIEMLVIRNEQMKLLAHSVRKQFGWDVVKDLEASTPHAVMGLTPAEVEARLEAALSSAEAYELRLATDLRAFIRLCFVVGPRFADYPPVQTFLRTTDHLGSSRLAPLFRAMLGHGWQHAADYDIVTRAREPIPTGRHAAGTDCATRGSPVPAVHSLSLEPLESDHASAHFQHALHPDVWRLGRMQPRMSMEKTLAAIQWASAGDDRQAYAIVDAELGLVGAISLHGSPPLATIAYWVARPYWACGVGTGAIGKLLGRLRMQGRITRLRANVARTNQLSMRLLERLGWTELAQVRGPNGDSAYELDI